jgi:dihydroorotate dehydrogenase (NAD+) catalytic subunit
VPAVQVPPPSPPVEVDLVVDLGRGLVLRTPIVVASGAFGYGTEHGDDIDMAQLGAICTRGTTRRPRIGNAGPRLIEVAGGLLNGVGLQNPGVDAVVEKYAPLWAAWRTPVVVNVAGETVADYVEIVRRLEGVSGVAGIELNLSCPNRARGGLQFGLDAAAAGELTAAVRRATDLPLVAKLSPNATDVRSVARAVEAAGADALSAINTVSAMAVGPSRTGPLLGSTYGGLSGPAIRPIAMRVVHELAAVVDIPVIAAGGVSAIADVLDFLALGAVAVQVGTAMFADPELPARLADELAEACRRRGLSTYTDLIGTAQPKKAGPPSTTGVEYRP